MRSLLILPILCVALASAAPYEDDVDWSKVKMRDVRIPLPFDLDKVIFEERIVGGEEAVANSIPFQAGLLMTTSEGTFFCGGSLISRRFVLTAAHCVDIATQVQVRLGAHRINDNEDTQWRDWTNTIVIHSAWNPSTLVNDIAVVQLQTEAPLNQYIQLVPLPRFSDANNNFSGENGRISGWGIDADGASSISPVLRLVDVNVITNLACNLRYLGIIQPSHICTSGDGGRGPCSGDSGGPLMSLNRQVGIASFALALGCERGWPAGYARVTSYLDWIQANTDVTIWA